jgi:hypothetical protein
MKRVDWGKLFWLNVLAYLVGASTRYDYFSHPVSTYAATAYLAAFKIGSPLAIVLALACAACRLCGKLRDSRKLLVGLTILTVVCLLINAGVWLFQPSIKWRA